MSRKFLLIPLAEMYEFTPGVLFCMLAWMPDGIGAEGTGPDMRAAEADARRRWRRWKSSRSGPLAVDGRAYQRRLRARRRRQA